MFDSSALSNVHCTWFHCHRIKYIHEILLSFPHLSFTTLDLQGFQSAFPVLNSLSTVCKAFSGCRKFSFKGRHGVNLELNWRPLRQIGCKHAAQSHDKIESWRPRYALEERKTYCGMRIVMSNNNPLAWTAQKLLNYPMVRYARWSVLVCLSGLVW